MRFHRIPCRPAAQGSAASLRVRHSATGLTDGAGHLLVRQLWDQFALSARIDHHAPPIGGHYRASTMCETWVTGLLYGVEHLDDLTFLASRSRHLGRVLTSLEAGDVRGGGLVEVDVVGIRSQAAFRGPGHA